LLLLLLFTFDDSFQRVDGALGLRVFRDSKR
jgi:hypothetical protein